MKRVLIPLTVALALVSVTAPIIAQDTREPLCFAVHTESSTDATGDLKLRLDLALARYAPLCDTVTGKRHAVLVNIVAIVDNGLYYVSYFVWLATGPGVHLQYHTMGLHVPTLDPIVDSIVTRALGILKQGRSLLQG